MGRKQTEETRRKISLANKGLKYVLSDEERQKRAKLCSLRFKGKKKTIDHIEKLSGAKSIHWKGGDRHKVASKKYYAKYPEKQLARTLAIKKTILLDKCEVCGKVAKERHHPDYSKPLYVISLCIPCHKQIHKELKLRVFNYGYTTKEVPLD